MTNSRSEPKDDTPVSKGDVPNIVTPQNATSSSSNECTHGEASETGVVARCLKRRRSSDDDYPTNNYNYSRNNYHSSNNFFASYHYFSSSNNYYYSSSNNHFSSTGEYSSSNNYRSGFFTPEQEEALRNQREKIERIKDHIKKENEKIERADACIKMFQRWPELISHLGSLASVYGEQALQDLVKKIDDENLSVVDPWKKFNLLFTFFKNRRDMNIRIKNLIHQHIMNLMNETKSESSESSDQTAICKYEY